MMYRAVVLILVMLGLSTSLVQAQEFLPMAPEAAQPQLTPGAPPGMPPGQPTAPPAYTQQQIDQMLAPIALYPDPLIGQVLMASTYPLEIVEAQRWLQNPQNAALKGDQLQAALAQQPWDPSVKSLVAFPQILNMMNNNLQWTEQLGDAFLANQAGVMDSVQHLRQMAQASGHLNSTPQETVSAQNGAIMIEPPTQQTVYIPYYDPAVVYGAWPYPGYPPYYFPPPPGYVYYPGIIGFGFGIGVVDWLWGWNHWDWWHHRIDIDPHRWAMIDPHRPMPSGGVWMHNPADRHGVPYHSAAVRAQFGGAQAAARANFRGYFNQAGAAATARPNAAQYPGASHFEQHSAASPAVQSRGATPEAGASRAFSAPNEHSAATQRSTQMHAQTVSQQRSAPMFESFSRGQEVRAQSMRGAASRAAMAPARAPAGGGNRSSGGSRESGNRNH